MRLLWLQTSMILALFEASYTKNSDTLLAKKRARTRLALASSFVLARSTDPDAFQSSAEGPFTAPGLARSGSKHSTDSESSTGAFDSSGLAKAQCMALVRAMNEDIGNGQEHGKHHGMSEIVFTHLDQDNSGRVEFIEFENLLLICRCCDELSRDRLLAHKATIARADQMKADAHVMLTYELSNKQQHLLEETVACQEKTLANAHAEIEAYLNHLNRSFRICGRWESQQLDKIAVIADIIYFFAMALGATAWVGVGFNFVYSFEVII